MIFNFFKKPKNDTIEDRGINSDNQIVEIEEQVRLIKKEATQLKKTNPNAAAIKIKEAIDLSIKNQIPPFLDTELRYASYLYNAGNKDAAFNEIARLMHYGTAIEPAKEKTSTWYFDQCSCIKTRITLLSKEKTTQSWIQYIDDSFLHLYYEAMAYKTQANETHEILKAGSIERLEFVLKFEDEDDLKKVGWKGFKALKLEKYEQDLLRELKSWASNSDNLDINRLSSWFQSILIKENR